MSRLCLYFKQAPERDRWFPGDRLVRPLIRRTLRGKPPMSGVDKVFHNLCLGLNRIAAPYRVNLSFREIDIDDKVGVMGRGPWALHGYDRPNRIVAGPYLMTHPSEWPTLCEEYPVVKYLQHCRWANDVYKPYFGERCTIWAHGVDTHSWKPSRTAKDIDLLVYDKVRWNREHFEPNLLEQIRRALRRRDLRFTEIRYGFYREEEYRRLLARARAMIFLVEHESQGSACQECLSCDVPIFAWEPGRYLDPNRFKWGEPDIPASSVPYFDARCGMTFAGFDEFDQKLDKFIAVLRDHRFAPRDFVVENLTVEKCAQRYIDLWHDFGTA